MMPPIKGTTPRATDSKKGPPMPLEMNREVFITCAVTGAGSTQNRTPHVPRSPAEIAESAIAAARAGAAIVHCHVRDPQTGAPARDVALYREVTERIRESEVDVVLNLTAGMGGDLVTGPPSAPLPLGNGTDMASAEERLAHVAECQPELATLDCGTMNFAEADHVMTNTPGMLVEMGRMMTELGVRPEIEAFDTGHLWHAKKLVEDGVLEAPALVQLCMAFPGARPMISTPSWRWSTTCRRGGISRPSPSAAMKCPAWPRRCWPGATCGWDWKTTCGWERGCWPPTRLRLSARWASSSAWAHG